MERVAKELEAKNAIENFSKEAIFNNILNNYEGSTTNSGPTVNYNYTFKPLDKFVEFYEDNKKL